MESLIFPITALIAAWILGTLLTKGLIPVLEKKQFRQFVDRKSTRLNSSHRL